MITFSMAVFILIGLVSMLTHALKKWAAGEIKGSWVRWYLDHPRASVNAVLTCVGGIIAAVVSGALVDYHSISQVIAAWGIGYAADSVNSQ